MQGIKAAQVHKLLGFGWRNRSEFTREYRGLLVNLGILRWASTESASLFHSLFSLLFFDSNFSSVHISQIYLEVAGKFISSLEV